MLYIIELISRLKYILISFLCSCFISYYYKDSILIILSWSLLKNVTLLDINSFIFNSPTELLKIYLFLIIFFSIFCIIPLMIYSFLNFIKTGCAQKEYILLKKISLFSYFFFIITNLISFFFVLPWMWAFFSTFNNNITDSSIFFFSFQLKLSEYLKFMLDLFYYINIFILLSLILCGLISFFGLKYIIYWRKIIILINIIFATLLSPPDVYSQLIIFGVVLSCSECLTLLCLILLKYNKQTILKWHHIKR